MNVIARLEYELAYYDSAVHRFNHYTTRTPMAFRWFTATTDRNAEFCNRIPSNYCLPYLLSITPRFWPSKPLAGLGRIWNRYFLTMPTWNRRDSMPLSAAPQAPAFLSEVAVNHLKKARGEIWPKRSEKETTHTKKNYQDEDKKSAINKK